MINGLAKQQDSSPNKVDNELVIVCQFRILIPQVFRVSTLISRRFFGRRYQATLFTLFYNIIGGCDVNSVEIASYCEAKNRGSPGHF